MSEPVVMWSATSMCELPQGVSSRRLRQEFEPHVRRYLWGGRFWSGSYFAASCGGAPLTVVKQYIRQQQRPT